MFKWGGYPTAAFIDGANTHTAAKTLGYVINFKKLLSYLESQFDLLDLRYYTAYRQDSDTGEISIKKLMDWLSYNGYSVVSKQTKEFLNPDTKILRVKGNMDCEMIVDAFERASKMEHMILFSGDGDFAYLLEAMHRRSIRTTVVSTMVTNPPMIADNLRKTANHFVDLATLRSTLEAHVAER